MRNASTGSPWPVTNNPHAMFNDRGRTDCNLEIPIWKLLRASTAAPTYFAPEPIDIGRETHLFVDGGITPYNNPALIAALTVILPCYGFEWPTGVDRLQLVSIGTCREKIRFRSRGTRVGFSEQALYVPPALLSSISLEQDLICRLLGECRFGHAVDAELGTLSESPLLALGEQKFSYVRYNHEVTEDESADLRARTGQEFTLDNLLVMPWLQEIGRRYAMEAVRPQHFVTGDSGGSDRHLGSRLRP
jgi:hypothetical protein